jgi:hypothetical protein
MDMITESLTDNYQGQLTTSVQKHIMMLLAIFQYRISLWSFLVACWKQYFFSGKEVQNVFSYFSINIVNFCSNFFTMAFRFEEDSFLNTRDNWPLVLCIVAIYKLHNIRDQYSIA